MADFEDAIVVEQASISSVSRPMVEEQKRQLDPLEKQKLSDKIDYKERQVLRELKMAKLQEDFEKKFKNFDELFVAGNIKVPEIIYVANKAEDGYEGDILGEFYQKFPNSALSEDMDPIFISAEHGDGFQDLYARIQQHIPAEKLAQYESRKEKRLQRFMALKDDLLDELVDFKISLQKSEKAKSSKDPDYVIHNDPESEEELEMFIRQWEKDFDRSNKNPEDNSDFDSDNDINPLDSVNQHGEYTSSA